MLMAVVNRVEFLFTIILLAVATAPLAADSGTDVEVEADSLQIDHKRKAASFRGNVRATYGDIKLSCDIMSVTYNDDGKVTTLKAEGKVRVQRGDAMATASTATLDARLDLLVLLGKPILVQGPHRLEGKRITVHLGTGKVDVQQARGKFKLGAGDSKK